MPTNPAIQKLIGIDREKLKSRGLRDETIAQIEAAAKQDLAAQLTEEEETSPQPKSPKPSIGEGFTKAVEGVPIAGNSATGVSDGGIAADMGRSAAAESSGEGFQKAAPAANLSAPEDDPFEKAEANAQARDMEAKEDEILRKTDANAEKRQQLSEKIDRSMGDKGASTSGFLGSTASALVEGRNLNKDQAKAKYEEEYKQLQQAEREVALEAQQYGLAPEDTAMIVEEAAANSATMKDFTTLAKQLTQQQAIASSKANTLQSQLNDLDQQWNALQNKTIDPQRFWKNQSSGDKARLGWAIVLGSMGNRGQGNQALQIIKQQIDHDVAAQQADIQKEFNILKEKRNLLGAAIQANNKTPISIRPLAHKAKLLQATIVQGQQLAGSRGANTEAVNSMITDLTAELELTREQMAREIDQGAKYPRDMITGSTPAHLVPEDLLDRFVDGVGLLNRKEDANSVLTAKKTMFNVEGAVNELLTIMDQNQGREDVDPRVKSRVDVLVQELIGAMRLPLFGPGAFQLAEQKQAAKIIGNPSDFFSLNISTQNKLDQIKRIVRRGYESELKTYVLNPGPAGGYDPSRSRKQ